MLHTPPLEFPYKDRPNTRGNTPAMAAGAADARSAPAAEGFTTRDSPRVKRWIAAAMRTPADPPADPVDPPRFNLKGRQTSYDPGSGWDSFQMLKYRPMAGETYEDFRQRLNYDGYTTTGDHLLAGVSVSLFDIAFSKYGTPEQAESKKTWLDARDASVDPNTSTVEMSQPQPEQGVNGATIAAAPAPASPATPQSPGEVGAPPTQPMDAATLSDPQALITRANSPENVAKVVDVYNASAAQGAFNGASVSPDTLTKGVNLQQQIANLSVEDVQVFMQAINDSQTAMAKEIRAGLEASGVNVPELIGQYASQIEAGEMPDETGQAILDQGAAAAGKTSEEGANDSNFLEGLFAMWEGLESSQKMGLMIGIPLVAIGLFSGVMGGGPMLSAGLGLAGLAAGAAGMAGLFGGEEEAPQQPGGPGSAAGASGDGGALTPPPAPGQPVPPPAPGQPGQPPAPGQPAPNQPAAPAAGGGVIGDTNNDGKVDLAEGQAVLRDPAMKQQLFNLPPAQQKEYLRSLPQEAKTKFESMVMPYNINSFGSRQKVYDAAQKEGLTPAEVDAIIKIIGPSGKIG